MPESRKSTGLTPLERFVAQSHAGKLISADELNALLGAVAAAAIRILEHLQGAGLHTLQPPPGSPALNASGEPPKPLDLLSNSALQDALRATGMVGIAASEELEQPAALAPGGAYAAAFDPLDGSSNIDSGITLGTVIGFYRNGSARRLLRPGREMVMACYVLYGTFTQLMYCAGEGAHLFTLDRAAGKFMLMQAGARHAAGHVYSVNEAHAESWPRPARLWLAEMKRRKYATRYIGSLVGDFHRNLLDGGVFAYPANAASPSGKLRLLYECAPLALIAEAAGGAAVDGRGRRILELAPQQVHQRSPLFIGNAEEVDFYRGFTAT